MTASKAAPMCKAAAITRVVDRQGMQARMTASKVNAADIALRVRITHPALASLSLYKPEGRACVRTRSVTETAQWLSYAQASQLSLSVTHPHSAPHCIMLPSCAHRLMLHHTLCHSP